MNTRTGYVILFAFLSSMLSSCKLIGDIFKAGVWTGVLAVVGIIILVAVIVYNIFGKNK